MVDEREKKVTGMREDADKIANLVMQTSTENRGELLMQVAIILQTNFQGYTSSVFYRAAVDYGLGKYGVKHERTARQ